MKAFLALLAVLAAAAGLVGVGEATRAEDRPAAAVERAPQRVPVVAAGGLCPDVGQVPGALSTRVTAGAALVSQPAGPGTLTSQPLAGGAPMALPLARSGSALTGLGSTVTGDGLEVDATGNLAPGLEVEALATGSATAARGLAGMRCAPASVDQWFFGGGTRIGESSALVLANPDPAPALVDVTVFGVTREADAAPGRGLVVPARGRLAVPLNDLAPDLGGLVVRVEARRGRVAGAVRTSRVNGRFPAGVEWAPLSPAPATRVVVPGVTQAPGGRRVLVANPGDEPLTVALDLTTTDGQDSPEALAAVPVPARRVVAVDLAEAAAAGALAVTVRSSGGPVLAVGLLTDGTARASEMALAAAAAPLTGPALLADVSLSAPVESSLILSAVDGDAVVRVTAVPLPGRSAALQGPQTVQLPGGSTRVLQLSSFAAPGSEVQFSVRVEPVSGAVYASRHLRVNAADGPRTTSLALQSATDLVERPEVLADPRAGRVRPVAGR